MDKEIEKFYEYFTSDSNTMLVGIELVKTFISLNREHEDYILEKVLRYSIENKGITINNTLYMFQELDKNNIIWKIITGVGLNE